MGLRQSQIRTDELKEALVQDVSRAQEKATQARTAIGVAPKVSEEFSPRAIRIKGRAGLQAELKEIDNAAKEAIDELLFDTGISDQIEAGKARQRLSKMINQIKLESIRVSGDISNALEGQKLSAEQRIATFRAFGDVAGGVTRGLFSRASGPSSNELDVGDPTFEGGGVGGPRSGGIA